MQHGGGHGWQRDLHPAWIHLLLAGWLPGEEERGQWGERGQRHTLLFPRASCWVLRLHSPFPAGKLGSEGVQPVPAASLVLHDPVHGLCPKLTLVSAVLQLPVMSVVRDAESQLLPDVGAMVTCKVGCTAMANCTAFALSALC